MQAKVAPGGSTSAGHARPVDGRARAVVEGIAPNVDEGRFAAKRVVGDVVIVEADCFADGHDVVAARLRYRHDSEANWREATMEPLGNDRYRGRFVASRLGRYHYTVAAWVDPFLSWRHDFARRVEADDLRIAARVGAEIVSAAAQRAGGEAGARLAEHARSLQTLDDVEALRDAALDDALLSLANAHPDRGFETVYPVVFPLVVDRERARFSSWYELFPRSASETPGTHGTFDDVARRLRYIAAMGFDVVYLPPIHPIGRVRRKGPNNTLVAGDDDVGSPWAIGAAEGGHQAIHPMLGDLAAFRRLVAAAKTAGMEIALDVAFQCAPDHPYVAAHPKWFRWRPDNTVQYAENPPKKYQDIYPFNFESSAWRELWDELADVFAFWIREGIRVFRVDNPHTKPFPFWEWVIGEVKRDHPDVIFLSEAFTRPKVMHRLAKLGFTQSYTYFTWRNTKKELVDYFTELHEGPGRDYFRPNAWPNTPDILPESLQFGGRPVFMSRLVLAGTLAGNYGIYGPAYELLEHQARDPGSEEYLDSEKYQIRHWDLARAGSLAPFITRVNRARRQHAALQGAGRLVFVPVDNDDLIAYARFTDDRSSVVLVVVNLDPHHVQSGWVTLDLEALGLDAQRPFQLHDLLTDARYLWSGPRNFVQLDPSRAPAHVLLVRRRVRTERDFDYFL